MSVPRLLVFLFFLPLCIAQVPGVSAELSGGPWYWYDNTDSVPVNIIWTTPTDLPGAGACDAIRVTVTIGSTEYILTTPASPGTSNALAQWPGVGWPDGAESAPIGPLPDATDRTIEVGYIYSGTYYSLLTAPFTLLDYNTAEGGFFAPGSVPCGGSITVGWAGLVLPTEATDIILQWRAVTPAPGHAVTGDVPAFTGLFTLDAFDYLYGSHTITGLPSGVSGYAVEISLLADGNPVYNEPGNGFGTMYSEVPCGGSGGGGGDPEGAWDQPEIDTLLARQSELVALATTAESDRGAIIAELQAITAALGASSALTQAQLSEVLGAPNSNGPTSTDAPLAAGPYIAALGGALPVPTAGSLSGTGATINIPFPTVAGGTTSVAVNLDPDTWPDSAVYNAFDVGRGVIRSLLVVLIAVSLSRAIWQALRQY